jgi:anti-sigma-K factor RskA
MNIQAYIESGILEEYVLGTVSTQEKQEVECMSHIYPEIKAELLKTEDALEQYALKHQTAPPDSLKESIFAQMTYDQPVADRTSDSISDLPEANEQIQSFAPTEKSVEIPFTVTRESAEIVETKIITPAWAKLALAASVFLALFAAWLAIEMTSMKSEVAALTSDKQELTYKMETVERIYAYKESLASMYSDPDYKVVKMTGIPTKSPESLVSAFWNQKTNEVMVDVKKLPSAPAGKQYQLWSIVDGVPVDIGMLDAEFMGKVLKMKHTKTGSVAFAITLEKTGGSPTPTMEEMYVMGKV